jgi:two-component system, NarL family, sensor histidine kinase UhpB
MDSAARPEHRSRPTLFARIFLANAVVLIGACAILIFSPITVSHPAAPGEAAILVGGLVVMLILDVVLTRRAVAPLERLTKMTRQIELLEPGRRIPIAAGDAEVMELTLAFNEMVDRLERERRDSVRRSLEAQEEERRRIAQELHDEVGQTLTAAVLHLNLLAKDLPASARPALEDTLGAVRDSLDDVRRISRLLRPEALDDLGLSRALAALVNRMRESSGARIEASIDDELPTLSPAEDLVIYRVAQEAMTNALRHSGSSSVRVDLGRDRGGVVLTVGDDGTGIDNAPAGGGIQGMRERALLIGARLTVGRRPQGGTEVRLEVARVDGD